ncbi:DUF5677 domain-containing protein [Sulfurovum sp.]|uniref:DUF5677 domain-containing protein n=1 Tax=Sulfurovum sp. TaxID=1969726 RepID=UPI00356A1F09
MDTLDQEFERILNDVLEKYPEKAKNLNIESIISDITSKAFTLRKKSLLESAENMLLERRQLAKEFVERNINRWSNAFDILEMHIVICTEAGEDFNNSYRPQAVEENNLVFDLVVRHHARACHIAQEILCLLKNGFADAAHARWRALHEVTATAMFIAKHGQECAERFYFHDIVDSYEGMKEHKKYEDRLQAKGPSQEEINGCQEDYNHLINRYGKKYADHYGWASYLFPNHGKVGFAAIEKDVQLDHMRPYYKWASQNIHASSKGMSNRLGLCEATEDLLLVGQSNSGMTDPAHAMAISLSQITSTLLTLEPTLAHLVTMKIISDFEKQVGNTFLEIDTQNDS